MPPAGCEFLHRPAAEGTGGTNVGFAVMPPAGLIQACDEVGLAIAAEAREWLGTPFLWQGRLKGVGCDCKGLVAGVAAACGRAEGASLEALAGDYGARVDSARLKAGLARLFDRVSGPLLPGDVLLLRSWGKAQHLALIGPEGSTMIHTYSRGPGCVIEGAIGFDQLDSAWRWRERRDG